MDKMDSVAIDPELFMLCRLCTEEKGMFQIVPKVQMQIKDCFDITVEQFDGLSQLVCGKCKEILNNYNEMKKKYQEKQTFIVNKRVQQSVAKEADECAKGDTQPQTEPPAEENKVENLPIENNTVSSTKSDEITVPQSPPSTKSNKAQKRKLSLKLKFEDNKWGKPKSVFEPWQANYVKKFNCRFCPQSVFSRSSIIRHVNSHRNLLNRKNNLIAKECFVSLERVDGKTNFTGNNCITTLNQSLLSESKFHNDNNFITYVPKISPKKTDDVVTETSLGCLSDASTVDLDPTRRKISESMNVCDKSSSEDESFLQNSKRMKRTHLLSSSEYENDVTNVADVTDVTDVTPVASSPVVKALEVKPWKSSDPLDLLTESSSVKVNKPEPKKKEVVNLDHKRQLFGGTILKPKTSNNESLKKDLQQKNFKKFNEFKPIRNIITMAYHRTNRSKNKEDRSSTKNDVHLLNKKLLSIGRKVMSKTGYSSIGLLKYLAKRNLHIAWTDQLRSDTKSSKDGNVVRIMTREMIDETNNLQGFTKSIFIEDSCTSEITSSEYVLRIGDNNHSTQEAPLQVTDNQVKNVLDSILTNKFENNLEPINVAESEEKQSVNVNNSVLQILKSNEEDTIPNGNEASGTLLLNKSPVSNPKPPFRKKFNEGKTEGTGVEAELSASLSKCVNINGDINYDSTTSVFIVSSDDETVNNSVEMPIIASTTSLAPNQAPESKPESSVIKHSNESLPPRIKCKAVTDLMPEKIPHSSGFIPRVDISNAAKIQTVVNKFPPTGLIPPPNAIKPAEGKSHMKYPPMIFHTLLLPNTQTHSPFGYFKALLGMHTMKLIKPVEGKNHMRSLVKFTLVIQQRPIATEMCLELMVNSTDFCIRVSSNSGIVDIKETSATWQWEVLKAFRAEKVYTRAIEYAEKINNKTCYNTKLFFNILTSIQVMSI